MSPDSHTPVAVHWFRRDLRLDDNTALAAAHLSGLPVVPLFIFDTDILDKLEDRDDARVTFIFQTLEMLKSAIQEQGGDLIIKVGKPLECWKALTAEWNIQQVFVNEDYEPYARERDAAVDAYLNSCGISFKSLKDQVIFAKDEVLKDDGKPYTVFTPYSRKWKARLQQQGFPRVAAHNSHWLKGNYGNAPDWETIGFQRSAMAIPPARIKPAIIEEYHLNRNFPGMEGTTKLSVHLRFGTISIRNLGIIAQQKNETFLNELIWRDFYQMILWHFPNVVTQSFKPAYDNIAWLNNEKLFQRWCEGTTGYPIVDAGMRELKTTGFMHNRVRMITASFLTKHLLTDWRWGEAWFARHLLDFDLASNNGGWQWAAGSGCDAAPYFRIFNPYEQTKKFDPKGVYIRAWVKDLDDLRYPQPIVDHAVARKRALEVYKAGLEKK
jgi:deoxyribodipyrimidine photo-lyase